MNEKKFAKLLRKVSVQAGYMSNQITKAHGMYLSDERPIHNVGTGALQEQAAAICEAIAKSRSAWKEYRKKAKKELAEKAVAQSNRLLSPGYEPNSGDYSRLSLPMMAAGKPVTMKAKRGKK